MNTVLDRINCLIARSSILEHTFYKDWLSGRLEREDIRYYAEQWLLMEEKFVPFMESAMHRCDVQEVRDVIEGNMLEESGTACVSGKPHVELWKRFASIFGANTDDVVANDMTDYLVSTFKSLCAEGGWRSAVIALYAYESQIPLVCEQKISALKEHYGISDNSGMEFFTIHGELDKKHSQDWINIINKYFTDSDVVEAISAVERASMALNAFLDGVNARRNYRRIEEASTEKAVFSVH